MGKGNCLYQLIEGSIEMARCICCCLCVVFLAGPVCMIVGVIMIGAPNHRADNVKTYNDACTAWMSGDMLLMQRNSTFKGDGNALGDPTQCPWRSLVARTVSHTSTPPVCTIRHRTTRTTPQQSPSPSDPLFRGTRVLSLTSPWHPQSKSTHPMCAIASALTAARAPE
jgi:hypothetical protein